MLKLSNVSYSKSKKSDNLVNNVTLEVRDSDYVVISGQNNEERRALLEILGAVNSPRMGEMYIDGIELSKHTPNQLTLLRRGTYGYFLNDSELDRALTVVENIQLPLVFAGFNKDEIDAKVDRVLNIVGLIGFKEVKIEKLTEWQKNKLQIAVAIVKEPKVLVLDEPCRVQDSTRLAEVLGLLSALNREGITIIVASNNEEYFKVAKRRVEIAGGAITEMKKERAPRETTKKTKTKKTPKAKTVKEKTEEKKEITKEIKTKEEKGKEKPAIEAETTVVKPKAKTVDTKKQEEQKTTKTAGRPKKVAEVHPIEEVKKVGRPKKVAEEKTKTVSKTTKKEGGNN